MNPFVHLHRLVVVTHMLVQRLLLMLDGKLVGLMVGLHHRIVQTGKIMRVGMVVRELRMQISHPGNGKNK